MALRREVERQFHAAFSWIVREGERGIQAKIAREIGVEPSYINRIASGDRPGSEEVRRMIADSLGYTYEQILDLGRWILEGNNPAMWPGINTGSVSVAPTRFHGLARVSNQPWRDVPIISWVQAGGWTDIVDQFLPGDAEEFVRVFRPVSDNTFALRIVGDSMFPEFMPGDIIVVDPSIPPETGRYVVAKIENGNNDNGEATFKQFIRDGNDVYLKPLNEKYDTMKMTGKEFRIVGCVVQKTKEY